ncbi:MAG: hypothetical protein JNM27_10830 [Leptospirales bacterium]|nr:hypothetical protein [Leptospirales bacterium]
MFGDYFQKQSDQLTLGLRERLNKRGLVLPSKEKDVSVYRDFYDFLREHLPHNFSLATGKVRGKKHILNRSIDCLVYWKLCNKVMDMAGGYVLVDHLYSFVTLEENLSTQQLLTHCTMTKGMKALYAATRDIPDNQILPVFSVLFAYKSSIPLLSHKIALMDTAREKEIPVNHEPDLVCILDQGVIVKDWESGGYRAVETGKDTLMWFYVLLMEYLDRDGKVGFDAREYIKSSREYKEY